MVPMRKVISSTYVTLDGVMDDLDKWHFRFFDDEALEYAYDQLFASDALLMGRETYEGFAASWPSMTDEAGFADRMNGLPKYVASTTLQEPLEWNNATLIKGDVAEEVSRLKEQPGQDILMYGYGDLTRTLMQHGLLDELRMWVHPVVWGSGERPFRDAGDRTFLRLVDTTTFGSGVVVLSYQPA
jgi:dihydrofolate reductase